MGRPKVFYNNLNSYIDLGLNIEDYPVIPAPERNVIVTPIEGRDGDLTEDLGTYKDIAIPITFHLEERKNLKEKCRQIKKWLLGTKTDSHLIFGDDLDYFYKVKSCSIPDGFERVIKIFGKFTATFICEGLMYSKDGMLPIELTSAGYIYNEGYISKPIITIYGSGDIDFNIGSQIIGLDNVNEYITIDTPKMNAYKETLLLNNNMSGEFPFLYEGQNNITWTGNVTKVQIIPNWRYL